MNLRQCPSSLRVPWVVRSFPKGIDPAEVAFVRLGRQGRLFPRRFERSLRSPVPAGFGEECPFREPVYGIRTEARAACLVAHRR